MKILTNKNYDDLIQQITNAENRCRDNEKNYKKELIAKDNTISVLSIQNNALDSRNTNLLDGKYKLEQDLINYQNKLEVANNKIHELGSRIGGYVKSNKRLFTEVAELKTECDVVREKNEVIESDNKKLKGENFNLHIEIVKLKEEKSSLQELIDKLNRSLNIAKTDKKPSEYERRLKVRRKK